MLRAHNLEELVDVATLLSSQPLPDGRRVAVLTNAGGLGILCADACETAELELPALADETRQALAAVLPSEASVSNPVDLLGSATGATYAQALPVILRDPGVDAVIVLFVPPVVAGADEVAAAIRQALEAEASQKPVLAVVVSADGTPASLLAAGSPVATFAYPESAARALGLAAARAEWLRQPAGTVPKLDGVDRAAARQVVETVLAASDDAWLEPAATRALLTAYGVPVVPEQTAADAEAAVAAARSLGGPVVVKTAAAGAHKTETGGVALNLETDDEVRAAAERIGGPVLVQPMVRGGTELLAGIVQDPVFGPLVAFGPGGVLAELIGGAGFRIAPLIGPRRRAARAGRQGRTPRPGLPRRRTGGRARARRARRAAVGTRRRPTRGRGARPQPGHRAAARLRRRRRPHPGARAGRRPLVEELVAPAETPQRRSGQHPMRAGSGAPTLGETRKEHQ